MTQQYIGNSCPVGIQPYAVAPTSQEPKIINLNYTCQDFHSLKTKLLQFLYDRFGPSGSEAPGTFNDFTESDLAVALIEMWAFAADLLSFKLDQIANEPFIDTVTELDNAYRLAKFVGFQPTPPIAATTLWSATIGAVTPNDVVIPSPVVASVVVGGQTQYIELYPANANNQPMFGEDIIIPAGALSNNSIIGLQGTSVQDYFVSPGGGNQSYQTGSTPVIFGSVSVMVDGIQWDQVDYFTDSNPRREYRVEYDANYRAYVMFGDGKSGLSPAQGSQIYVSYRVGGGAWGNIVSNSASFNASANVAGLNYSVPVTFRNYTRGIGGYDGDTIEDIRSNLPRWIKTQNRAVSGRDYKTLCDQFATPYSGKVGKSNVVLRHYGCAANVVDIYVLALDAPNGLMRAGNDLKVLLNQELQDKKMLTDHVCIRDGSVIYVDTSIEAVVDAKYRKFQEQIRTAVSNAVAQFYSLANWEYGQTLREMDLSKALASIQYLGSANISFTTDDKTNSGDTVTAKYYEIVRPSNLYLSFTYV